VLGAIVAFIIDRKFMQAALFALFGAALSWIGLIHGEKVEWASNPQVTLGYVFVAAICAAFMLMKLDPVDRSDEELAIE
jgi:AGZA family xanthine/uracil permease-like MFS transporter